MKAELSSKVYTTAKSRLTKIYNGNFPFPKPDSFGICNNYKAGYFM